MAIVRPGQTWRTDQGPQVYVDEVQGERVVGTLMSELMPDAFSAVTLPLTDFARFDLLEDAQGDDL